MHWEGDFTPTGYKRNAYSFRCDYLKQEDMLKNLGIGVANMKTFLSE